MHGSPPPHDIHRMGGFIMTNEKSLQVAQGLRILSLLIASGALDAEGATAQRATCTATRSGSIGASQGLSRNRDAHWSP